MQQQHAIRLGKLMWQAGFSSEDMKSIISIEETCLCYEIQEQRVFLIIPDACSDFLRAFLKFSIGDQNEIIRTIIEEVPKIITLCEGGCDLGDEWDGWKNYMCEMIHDWGPDSEALYFRILPSC